MRRKILSKKLLVRVIESKSLPVDVLNKRWPNIREAGSDLMSYVKRIIDEVKERGDSALIKFEERFDGVKLSPEKLRINREDIEKAYEKIDEKLISAIEFSKSRVETLQKEILKRIGFEYKEEGLYIRNCTSPFRRIGCYIPGGKAAYPSSVIMMATPAKVAGVPEISIASPPRNNGEIDPSVLVAADICGVNEIYRIGGAQAIAALAYGTQTVKPVDKIVGPGNRYVQAAKILVSKDLPIDIPAGPSEIAIIADGSADPRLIALDMISQAEHLDAVSILVTTSGKIAEGVLKTLERQVSSIPNREIVSENLSRNGLIITCKSLKEAIGIVNDFAPEHLEIMTRDAWKVAEKVTSAGLLLIGADTPVAASDYCLGTVHILPTGGFSHVYSGLSVLDFVKHFCVVECSKRKLQELRDKVMILAESEGLKNHSSAVEGRFDRE